MPNANRRKQRRQSEVLRDTERERSAFSRALKSGVVLVKHPSKPGKARKRMLSLSRDSAHIFVHNPTSTMESGKSASIAEITAIERGTQSFATVMLATESGQSAPKALRGVDVDTCFSINGVDRTFDMQVCF